MKHKDMEDNRMRRRRVYTPEVFQVEAAECGAACLAMILRYYHCDVPMEELRYHCGVSRDGSNAAAMVLAAEHYGLKGHGYSKSMAEMKDFPVPCILHWGFNHFVVLEGICGNHVYLNDPAVGHRRTTLEDMEENFTGIVLWFEKTERFQRREQPSKLTELIRERLTGQLPALVYLVLTGVLLVFPGTVIPILTSVYVDDVVMNGKGNELALLLVCLAGGYCYRLIFNWIRASVLARLRLKLYMLTSYELLQRLFRLPIPFFDQRYPGELSQRLENNNDVNKLLVNGFIEAVLNVVEALFYLILMLIYSPVLATVGFVGVAVNILLTILTMRPLRELALKQRQDQNRLSGMMCAGLSVFSTIKASGAEDDYARDILGAFAGTTESEQRMGKAQQVLNAFPSALSGMFEIAVMMVGVNLVIQSKLTAGMLIAFVQLLTGFTQPVNELLGFSQSLQMMKANMTSIEDIESSAEDIRFAEKSGSGTDGKALPERFSGLVECRNVTFSYREGLPPILQELNLKVAPGYLVGITGVSGCGKSTLIRLLSGLLYPDKGEILYDGYPLQTLPAEVLNRNVAGVGQNSFFFSGSLRDNLTLWNRKASDEEIQKALQCVNAGDLLTTFPDGLDHYLEEGGKNLSGGQRQKLEIARALLRKPAVLLLDEATSAMDSVTEAGILEHLRKLRCTCIVVAHRLSTIRSCDSILVMDQGRFVQQGTHEELYTSDSSYTELLAD